MFLLHINTLRALAIICIILFHLNAVAFPNGYLGVETFLVISGFLLTRSFVEKGAPHPWDFAKKKVIRIIPPLAIAVLLTCIASLFFVFDNKELQVIYRTAAHALLGKSNIYLAQDQGYFATETANNALMHTWYIGVTIQLYLIYIVLASTIGRFSKHAFATILIIIAAFSLLYCYVGSQEESELYYSTQARLWEAFCGAAALFLPKVKVPQKFREGLSCLALVGIILPALWTRALPFHITAPVVIICTIVYIAYAGETTVNRILSCKPLMFIGSISFSLYLVHYPLIVFFKNWNEDNLSIGISLLCLFSVLLVSAIFYLIVERKKVPTAAAVIIWIGAFAFALLFVKKQHLREAYVNSLAAYPAYAEPLRPADDAFLKGFDESAMNTTNGILSILYSTDRADRLYPLLHIGASDAEPSFVVIGDSNAEHLYAGLDHLCRKERCAGIHISSRFYPFWGSEAQYSEERRLNAFLLWLENHPSLKTVVIGQLWFSRFSDSNGIRDWQGNDACSAEAKTAALGTFCRKIQNLGRTVLLVAPMPTLTYKHGFTDCKVLAHKRLRVLKQQEPDYKHFEQTLEEYEQRNKIAMQALKYLEAAGDCHVLSTKDIIFRDGNTYCAFGNNNEQYQMDGTHLTPTGSMMILMQAKERLLPYLKPNRQ